MSDSKNEVDDETKPTVNENVDDKKSKSKTKNDAAAKKGKNNAADENEENSEEASAPETKPAKAAIKSKKGGKKTKAPKEESDDEERKIPLLDQPPVIEGTRARKCVLKPDPPEEVKPGALAVPEGKGKPLGKISLVDYRIKRLRITTIKALHRLIFGRIGNVNLLESNIKRFRGFTFSEDSDEYNRKLTVLKKFQMPDLKELVFTFDLDMKIKKKEECAKAILNFLILPKESDKPHNLSINHPKRKATKRNYFEADVKEEESKKRKKAKPSKEVKKDEKIADKKETKIAAKTSKTNEKNSKNTDSSVKDEEQDNSSELKKPAKKRKRNQIIEEEVSDKTKNSPEKNENSKKEDNQAQDEESEADSAIEDDDQPLKKKSDGDKDKLSDEELRNFLKKVLADLNLESTTMKTVYNLISSEYPNYDFSKKKRFIKGVVKSLIQ